jgi:hypothetical protein
VPRDSSVPLHAGEELRVATHLVPAEGAPRYALLRRVPDARAGGSTAPREYSVSSASFPDEFPDHFGVFTLYREQHHSGGQLCHAQTEPQRKSPAVKLALPGNQAGNKAHWLARVECWLAHVERRLEPADQIDYLIRRSLLGPVNWGYPRGPHRFGHPLVQSLAGAGQRGISSCSASSSS